MFSTQSRSAFECTLFLLLSILPNLTLCPPPAPLRPCSARPCSDRSLALATFYGGFFFNQSIVALAEEVKRQIAGPFHAVHLRMEDDMAEANKYMGGPPGGMLIEFVRTMANTSFANTSTIYVASGLLLKGPSPGGWVW